jgi:hypothetical protein
MTEEERNKLEARLLSRLRGTRVGHHDSLDNLL